LRSDQQTRKLAGQGHMRACSVAEKVVGGQVVGSTLQVDESTIVERECVGGSESLKMRFELVATSVVRVFARGRNASQQLRLQRRAIADHTRAVLCSSQTKKQTQKHGFKQKIKKKKKKKKKKVKQNQT
jgi:hypothetical protein